MNMDRKTAEGAIRRLAEREGIAPEEIKREIAKALQYAGLADKNRSASDTAITAIALLARCVQPITGK